MGFSFGNALAAIDDPHIRACFQRLGNVVGTDNSTLSTIVRNNETVVSYATSGVNISAGAGLTGGGDLTADRTINVGAGTGITVAADSIAVNQAFTPTWTGVHTFSAQDVHNAGISLGTSGRLDSVVADTGTNTGFLIKPTTAFTSGRFIAQVQDSAGVTSIAVHPGGLVEFGDKVSGAVDAMVAVGTTTAKNAGFFFAPVSFTGAGQAFFSTNNSVTGAYFAAKSSPTVAHSVQVAGIFEASFGVGMSANLTDSWGLWTRGQGNASANSNSTRTWASVGGIKIFPALTLKNAGTFTNIYGLYVSNAASNAATTGLVMTNTYGISIDQQTRGGTINNGIFLANASSGYKAIAIRDQDAWIGSNAAATLTIGGTNLGVVTTNLGFYSVTPVARPSAYTQTYATADKTIATYTPDDESGAYTGIDNLQVGTVYATVADLNALRVAYENLRAFAEDSTQALNSVIDDGQALGLLQ